MRGAPSWASVGSAQSWIIPADAGSTLVGGVCPDVGPDHPRGCGEHCRDWMGLKMVQGSSPRMRGAPRRQPMSEPNVRIIPADAGSTPAADCQLAANRDHPRGCGEHPCSRDRCTIHSGSSPRMRGALHPLLAGLRAKRIIPADAGSTSWCPCPSTWGSGSSPRMRGAPYPVNMAGCLEGIIPADAGSTKSLSAPI